MASTPSHLFQKGNAKDALRAAQVQASINILFTADYFLPHAGGSRVYYYNLYSRLAQNFPDIVTVLTKKVPGWKQFDLRAMTDKFRIIRCSKPLPNLRAKHLAKIGLPLMSTFGQLLRQRIDIIHAGDLYPQGVIACLMKRWFQIPFVAFCHGEDITQSDRYRYQPRVRNWIYQSADAVIAACQFARDNLVRIGVPEQRIVTITPGVDYERFSPRPPSRELMARYDLSGRKVLLTVARIFPRKGHEIVIRAVARLVSRFPDLVYLIVGLGPEQKRLQELVVELGLNEYVRFTGYVPDESLAGLYNASDIFVMPNGEDEGGDIEGFGMVFLEANSAGKPVIAGRSGGTADSVVDGINGYRVDPKDVDEIASTIERLLRNPGLCARIGEAGRRRACGEFDWGKRAAQLRQLTSAIVQQNRMETSGTVSFARFVRKR